MSIIDDKASIILDRIDKIGSDFQKIFKTKFECLCFTLLDRNRVKMETNNQYSTTLWLKRFEKNF